MKKITTALAIMLGMFMISDIARSQDTTMVQTLTFDSITTRRGIWQFPEGEQFRKILMVHTLKCDPQTQHDQYWCGEWDYLTYNNIHQHTGVYDSILYHQASFSLVSGKEKDSVLLRQEPTYSFTGRMHKEILYGDTLELANFSIGEGTELIPLFRGGESKSYFLWKAEELVSAGITQGPLTGIKVELNGTGVDIDHLGISMKNVLLDSLQDDTLYRDMHEVYFNRPDPSANEWLDLNFYEAFNWDGSSDILLAFEFEYNEVNTAVYAKTEQTSFTSALDLATQNFALDLDGETDFIMAPPETYFNSDFTIETWLYKRSNNIWSRVFDFGTGPGQDNVIMTFTHSNSGRLSMHVNYDGVNRSFKSPEELPLNEWVHVSVSLTMHIGWLYINGELAGYGQLQQPKDTTRNLNYFGKSNWSGDAYADAMIDEFRIFNYAKDAEQIKADFNKIIADPASDENLLLYYKFDEMNGGVIHDHASGQLHARAYGLPSIKKIRAGEKYLDPQLSSLRPNIVFERMQNSYTEIQEELSLDSIMNSPTQLILYQQGENPTIPYDTITSYLGGYQYIREETGNVIDSVFFDYDEIMHKELIPYYGEPFEIIDRIEIGRFITPYGIGLDLGPDGFSWVYDVTDYAPMLQGEVDLSAGNQQELIDLKFMMIKGTPPREVKKIDKIWGDRRSYSYKNLDDDVHLSETSLPLLPEAETFKVKTRLTGHGHYSNTGDYPHCCEWKDNTHYLIVNSEQIADWRIFQYNECAENAVFPQGGTWPGAREGWCPGDAVKLNEFEITEYIQGDEVNLDYDITPVPPDNQGMGNGNYHIAMHLIQYSAPAFENDAELYDVIVPNDWEFYSRKNPACSDPKIIVRNNGIASLTSLDILYGVRGGEQQSYAWEGEIKSMEYGEITLPVPGGFFWFGDSTNVFSVSVENPNGIADEYPDNNTYTTHFNMPDMYNQPLVFWLKTNHQAYRYTIAVKDVLGETVFSRTENVERQHLC
ncbi:MAG: LamG-like jellyroll fold domain-containing protein [Bacteroidota bacterium]|nr:LamG-like jellyroll fold domain-containing protein [Bacteroidota bacterium]